MRALSAAIVLMLLLTSRAPAAPPAQCEPGEHMDDLSSAIPHGVTLVRIVPVGPIRGPITVYELGHPDPKEHFGGGGPGSALPLRFVLHGPGLFCTIGDGVQGFMIYSVEYGG